MPAGAGVPGCAGLPGVPDVCGVPRCASAAAAGSPTSCGCGDEPQRRGAVHLGGGGLRGRAAEQ